MRYHSDEEVAARLGEPVDLQVLAPVLGTTDPLEILRRVERFIEMCRDRNEKKALREKD